MSFHPAVKEQAKLRLALCGLAGAGKTYSALAIASGIATEMRAAGHGAGRIALIDTERGSASLYADEFCFDVATLDTYSPLSYVDLIKQAEAEYDIVIIDSLSHAWAGRDGALEQKDRAAETKNNNWTAWRDVTPKHNALVDAMIGCRAHLIATMRAKMEYVQDNVNGKIEIRKVGLAAIQRDGIEYEFTCVGDLDLTNTLRITKTRIKGVINPGDIYERPGASFAKKIYGWLMSGATPAPRVSGSSTARASAAVAANTEVSTAIDDAFAEYLRAMVATTSLAELDKVAVGAGKPRKDSPHYAKAVDVYRVHRAALIDRSKGVA